MATIEIARPNSIANTSSFAAALEAVRRAERSLPESAPIYQGALERLIAAPASDICALAAKMEVADPFDLDHHFALLADARRLAGIV